MTVSTSKSSLPSTLMFFVSCLPGNLEVTPVGKWLINVYNSLYLQNGSFHGKMILQASNSGPVFRQTQQKGSRIALSYPQFTYQLLIGIILQLLMTFLNYEHLKSELNSYLLSIATSVCHTSKPNHCRFETNRTKGSFWTMRHFGFD